MAISFLGRVVGAAQGMLHLVNGEGEQATQHASSQAYHPATPEQLVVKAEGQEAAARVHQVLAGLAGEAPLSSAISALRPELAEVLPFGEDDQDLINWLMLYKHFKDALANDGTLDATERAALFAELASNIGAGEVVKGWVDGLVGKLTGKPAPKGKK